MGYLRIQSGSDRLFKHLYTCRRVYGHVSCLTDTSRLTSGAYPQYGQGNSFCKIFLKAQFRDCSLHLDSHNVNYISIYIGKGCFIVLVITVASSNEVEWYGKRVSIYHFAFCRFEVHLLHSADDVNAELQHGKHRALLSHISVEARSWRNCFGQAGLTHMHYFILSHLCWRLVTAIMTNSIFQWRA